MIDISVEDKSVINIAAGDVRLCLTYKEAVKLLDLLSKTLTRDHFMNPRGSSNSWEHHNKEMWKDGTVYRQASDVI